VLASLFTTTAFSTSGPFFEQEDEERCAKRQNKKHRQATAIVCFSDCNQKTMLFKEKNNFFEHGPLNSEQQQQFREKTIQTTQFDDMFTQPKNK